MKAILLLCFLLFSIANKSLAQTIECGGGVFYGLGFDNAVYKLTLNGSSITLNGMVVPGQSSALYALAISQLGTETNKFYSSKSPTQLVKYDAGQWQLIFTDTAVFNNAAGNDNTLYYQQLGNPDFTKNRISKFTGNGLTLMWNDPVPLAVSDLAVDPSGNVYFFTGQPGAQTLNVMAPSGTITATYSTPFTYTTAYGCIFMDGKLYVAVGAANSQVSNKVLIPITFSNGTATVGQVIQMPAPVIGGTIGNPTYLDFKDLANCHPRNTLPITAVSFNADRISVLDNRISWKVTNEVDMKYYELEYSVDGTHFSFIERFGANTTRDLEGGYSYVHRKNVRGSVFYQLKMTDKQGNSQYSRIVKVDAAKVGVAFVYPNPAKDKLYVEYNGNASAIDVKITDAFGRTIYSAKKAAAAVIPVDISFPTGNYIVRVVDGDAVTVAKFVKE